MESVRQFVAKYKELLESNLISPRFIINVDESAAAPGSQHFVQAVNAISDSRSGQVMPPVDSLKTVLPFINAEGQVLMLVLIYANVHAEAAQQAKPIYYTPDKPATRSSFPLYYS